MNETTSMNDEEETPILGHFVTYHCTAAFWALEPKARSVAARAWFELLQDSADRAHLYVTQGIETSSEVLVWSTADAGDPAKPGVFFKQRAASENLYRAYFQPSDVLWGMTRPSQYSRAKSAQEIDPYADNARQPYLVMYPFTKTADWYLFGRETRQGMMNEHIRIGKQYREIKQLLLYSFGLQDQEFVVTYETDDLEMFSKLVYDLRDTEARRYTKEDTPLHTGVLTDIATWADIVAGVAG